MPRLWTVALNFTPSSRQTAPTAKLIYTVNMHIQLANKVPTPRLLYSNLNTHIYFENETFLIGQRRRLEIMESNFDYFHFQTKRGPCKLDFVSISHKYPRKYKKRRHVCDECGKAFKRADHLHGHKLSHAGPDNWKFCCEICGKKCSTKQKLEEHFTHSKEKPFQCSYCGEKYAHRHNLRAHVNRKHGDLTQDVARTFDKSNLTSKKAIPWRVGKVDESERKRRRTSGKIIPRMMRRRRIHNNVREFLRGYRRR